MQIGRVMLFYLRQRVIKNKKKIITERLVKYFL